VLRWPAELGQAARAALAEAELDRARAMQAGPSVDSAQSHLIFCLYFPNIFNYLQIQKFV
jgi:hypothetical protein